MKRCEDCKWDKELCYQGTVYHKHYPGRPAVPIIGCTNVSRGKDKYQRKWWKFWRPK